MVSKGEQLLTPLIPANTKQMQIIGMKMDLNGHLTLTPDRYYCHLGRSTLNLLMHLLACSVLKSLSSLLKMMYELKGGDMT